MPPPHDSDAKLPLLGEHYQLTAKLGEGAFGEVFRAHHDLLDQDFAVKLLKPELSEDKDVCDRFLDEARALIRFSHPNVVQMRHVGRHKGRLFLVMDFVEGVELGELIRKHGAFGEKRALAIIKQILSGLEAAHAAGIVHRDLKPSNILIESLPDGTDKAMILDFGLSKFSAIDAPGGAHRSITGTIVGTLAYMSPEQIKGDKDIDGRSDLFATGLILQEMLQGHHPYPGESGIVVAAKLLRDPIPPLDQEKAEKISDSTKSALGRALERDRDARFASVTAFAQSLEGRGPPSDTSKVTTVLEAQEELARQEALAAERAKGKGAAAGPAKAAAAPTKKKSPLVPILVVVVLVAGAATFFLLGKKDEPKGGTDGTEVARGTQGTPDVPGDHTKGPAVPKGVHPAVTPPKKDDVEPTPPKKDVEPTPPKKGDAEPPPPKKDDTQPAPPKKDDTSPTPPRKDDPAKDDPAKAQPVVSEPPTPAPTTPEPSTQHTPAEDVAQAAADMDAGKWQAARDAYTRAAEQAPPEEAIQVTALRGAAASWFAEADGKARGGDVQDALALYAEGIAWFESRHSVYERVGQAVVEVPLQLGYSRMYKAQFHVERARWLGLTGHADEAAAELEKARVAFDFALQTLDRRGVNHWELLIHRAQMHRLNGDTEKMIEDMRYATKSRDTSVPPHMWVAHAAAERRVAQALARQGKLGEALTWAKQADKVASDGVSWQENPDTGEYNLTRAQWLAMVRVVFVLGTVLPASEDPNPLHGRLAYWLSETQKKKAPAWMPADQARAKVLIAEAMERYLQGRVMAYRKKAAEADKIYGEALAKLTEAEGLLNAVAEAGGEKVDPLLFEVRAAVDAAQGKSADAQAAQAAAQAAAKSNPD